MKIPVTINNETFNLDEAQVATLRKALGINQRKLSEVPVGETFKLGDMEFIVLEHASNGTHVLLKYFWKEDVFDSTTNNYRESKIRLDLNRDFCIKVGKVVGSNNIITHNVNLTADDGRTEYESVEDSVSLLTCDQYRKYVYILDKYNPNSWWWLATPYSTSANGYSSNVRCVNLVGSLNYFSCFSDFGVRPFLILKSSIFVS